MSDSQDNVNKRQHEDDGAEQQVKRVRFEYDHDNLIEVLAGTSGSKGGTQQFRVHKDSICEKSSFFRAALSIDRWLEGQKKLVPLPEWSPKAVRTYIHWVYTGKILPEIFWQKPEFDEVHKLVAHIDLYLLAEYLDDVDMRVEIVNVLVYHINNSSGVPDPGTCRKVWKRAPKGSPLRSVILEWMIRDQCPKDFAASVGKLPKEFLEEMAVSWSDRASSPDDVVNSPEDFGALLRAQLLSLPVRDHIQ